MINIAICDDDIQFSLELETMINEFSDEVYDKMEIKLFHSGEAIIENMNCGNKYDFIFLDIKLGVLSGIDVGKFIRDRLHDENVMIIFISCKEEYAMELFSIRPLHFLIKPLNKTKVKEVFLKGVNLSNKFGKIFEYKIGSNYRKKYLKNILYFESFGKEIEIVTTDGREIFYYTLKKIYEELKEYNFFYCHKSYLVNYYHIKEFYYDKLKMTNNIVLPIAQPRRKEIRKMQNMIENGEF